VLDRLYIHAPSNVNSQRGVTLNSAWTAVVDSYISDIHGSGFDTQAVGGWNGPGPFKIVNNYLSASGENVFFGGADPNIPNLNPSDIEIRRNHIIKPLSWQGVWTAKNLFELKNAKRVLFEGNVLENSWVNAQNGVAIIFQALTDNNTAPWTTVQDVTVRYNRIVNAVAGVVVASRVAYATSNSAPVLPSQPSQRISFQNNLFEQIGSDHLFAMYGDLQDASIVHNTGMAGHDALALDGNPESGFVMIDNVVSHGVYGFFGTNFGEGNTALNQYVPSATIRGNVLFNGFIPTLYPTSNYFPATTNDVGFNNPAGGDYSLSAASAYRGKATDGTDPGVDLTALRSAISGVVQP
jgi:hypothetical protein